LSVCSAQSSIPACASPTGDLRLRAIRAHGHYASRVMQFDLLCKLEKPVRELKKYGNDSRIGARRIRGRLSHGSLENTGTTPVRALREYGNDSRTGARRIRERLPYGRLENTRMTLARALKGTISHKRAASAPRRIPYGHL